MCSVTAAVSPTEAILERARRELTADAFSLFEFYMRQYQPLCGDGHSGAPVTINTYDAWAPLMTFLESKMRSFLPDIRLFPRGVLNYKSSAAAPRGVPVGLPPIYVYQINNCDWFAGADWDSCRDLYLSDFGGEVELLEDGSIQPLTEDQLASLLFTDDDYSEHPTGRYIKRTFREELDRLIAAGTEFPVMFASTEF